MAAPAEDKRIGQLQAAAAWVEENHARDDLVEYIQQHAEEFYGRMREAIALSQALASDGIQPIDPRLYLVAYNCGGYSKNEKREVLRVYRGLPRLTGREFDHYHATLVERCETLGPDLGPRLTPRIKGGWSAEPRYAKNRHILKWWTPVHDELIKDMAGRLGDAWPWTSFKEIQAITDEAVIEQWRAEDPVCENYAWYNVIMYFAIARLDALGVTVDPISDEPKPCRLCGEQFVETALLYSDVVKYGVDGLDYCPICADSFRDGVWNVRKKDCIAYVHRYVEVFSRLPAQHPIEAKKDSEFWIGDLDVRLEMMKVLATRPDPQKVKALFGSWFDLLQAAGVLDGDAQKMVIGIRSKANDGHLCLSLGERQICDILHGLGIAHDKEPKYPEGNYRADWLVGETFVEFFGLAGNAAYDEKTKLKKAIAKRHSIPLVSIKPNELSRPDKLAAKLGAIPL